MFFVYIITNEHKFRVNLYESMKAYFYLFWNMQYDAFKIKEKKNASDEWNERARNLKTHVQAYEHDLTKNKIQNSYTHTYKYAHEWMQK